MSNLNSASIQSVDFFQLWYIGSGGYLGWTLQIESDDLDSTVCDIAKESFENMDEVKDRGDGYMSIDQNSLTCWLSFLFFFYFFLFLFFFRGK